MSDNLAEGLQFESEPEEHDQSRIVALKLKGGDWINVIPGTMELRFGDEGVPEVFFSVERADGLFEEGAISEITGLKSLPEE